MKTKLTHSKPSAPPPAAGKPKQSPTIAHSTAVAEFIDAHGEAALVEAIGLWHTVRNLDPNNRIAVLAEIAEAELGTVDLSHEELLQQFASAKLKRAWPGLVAEGSAPPAS